MKSTINIFKCIIFFLALLLIMLSYNLIYSIYLLEGIENIGRTLVILILITIDIILINESIKALRNRKRGKRHIFLIFLLLIYLILNAFLGLFIRKIYNNIDSMNKNNITYSTIVLALKDNNINDLNNKKIGILNDEASIDNYILAYEYINNNNIKSEIKQYSNLVFLVNALYNKEVDCIFITSGYESIFEGIDKLENIGKDTKVIAKYDKKVDKQETTEKDITKEPISILLMGIDSHIEGIEGQTGNGDTLILLTFNPNTLSATMLSIPRDSYVKQACFVDNVENKITHAAWGGTDCMLKTINNFLDINIDYYVKINFKGVVQLIDALGGVYVDVPKSICTDNSSREGHICIEKGYRKLNGEESLVLARNRYDFANGDFDREIHQQMIVEGAINSAKNIDSINEITNILNVVSNNIDTNLSTNQILSCYNILKKMVTNSQGKNLINITKLLLNGEGQMIYDEGMQMILWNYVLYKDSVEAVSNAMKINLGLIKPNYIKTFDYSIKNAYTAEVIGKNNTISTRYSLLPDFTNYTKDESISWLVNRGFSYEIKEEISDLEEGKIIRQSIHSAKRLDKITNKHIILTIAKNDIEKEIDETE